MRFSKIIVVVIVCCLALAGCKRKSVPARKMMFKYDKYSLNTLPPGIYDGVFSCSTTAWEKEDKSHSLVQSIGVSGHMYNDSGQLIKVPDGIKVTVNEVAVSGIDLYRGKPIPFHFPDSITWQIAGNDRYPSITHTITPEKPVVILSPKDKETVDIKKGFELQYDAADADSVLIIADYSAKVQLRGHPMDTLEDGGQAHHEIVRNKGKLTIPPLAVRTDLYSRFEPYRLYLIIMRGRGDTVHVGNSVYGFTAISSASRRFEIKP